jgi:type I restriction enzyme S subunit
MTSNEEQQFLNELDNAHNPLLPAAMVAINVPPGKGEFLFSRANTIESVCACVIVQRIDKDLLMSDKISRFVMPNEWKELIQLCLCTRHGRSEIESLTSGNQDSMRNITQGNIQKNKIPLIPEPELAEISAIVAQKTEVIEPMEIEY